MDFYQMYPYFLLGGLFLAVILQNITKLMG